MSPSETPTGMAGAVGIHFDLADFEVMDIALGQMPELRQCAQWLKRLRGAGIGFPVTSASALGPVFAADGEAVALHLHDAWFPVRSESDFVGRVYMALLRCRHERNLRRVHSVAPVVLIRASQLTESASNQPIGVAA